MNPWNPSPNPSQTLSYRPTSAPLADPSKFPFYPGTEQAFRTDYYSADDLSSIPHYPPPNGAHARSALGIYDPEESPQKPKKPPQKVRWPDLPNGGDGGSLSQEDFSVAYPSVVPPPKVSKSLPSSRRNSFSKEDLGSPLDGNSLLSQLINARDPPPVQSQPSYPVYNHPGHPNPPFQMNPVNYGQPPSFSAAAPLPFHYGKLDPASQQFPPMHQKSLQNPSIASLRRDSITMVPPQFSDHFLNDDEGEPSVGSPGAPSHIKKYLQKISTDSSQFPILLRRDSIPGMLSASSAALDLAPLPQTRRPSLNNERLQWDAARAATEKHRSSLSTQKEAFSGEEKVSLQSLNAEPPRDMRRAFSEELLTSQHHLQLSPRHDTDSPEQWDGAEGGRSPGICKFFRQGFCSRGDRCKFSHASGPTQALEGPHDPSLSSAIIMGGSSIPSGSPNSADGGGLYPSHGSPSSLNFSGPSSPVPGYASPFNASPPQGDALKNLKNLNSPNKKGHKRSTSAPEPPRFPPIEQLVGQIYSLCRDQHGCRYLQKKLEEGKEEYVDIIANEIGDHLLELMSDPFGNYLCQKLFIYANEKQGTLIATKVVDGLVEVSLNMHGTRSVQKLIDCMTTPEQIALIVKALRGSVVKLIKDLNGNHVIQKCLNKLTPEQNQFIYDAVTEHCVEVASHRHGCCVLQRCIDHASASQKAQLAREITANALPLVQDAFGNYVVQYILDLNIREFSSPLISRFFDHVFPLSLQKFSSNVIEKCIRVADPEIRRGLIAGVIDKDKIPMMLQDAFANYVIQTSLDVADPDQHLLLVELVRPLLPNIRHLPYCKRVQSKLNRDHSPLKPHPIHHFSIPPYAIPIPANLHH